MTFKCPQCPKVFRLETRWVYHLKYQHGLAPVLLDSVEANLSQVAKREPRMSTPIMPSVEESSPASYHMMGPKLRFKVAYDLGRGDNVQPIRTTIPRDESYDNFLRRLRYIFCDDSFERSLRQWECVLVNRQYEKGEPLPLTSPNTYYAMVGELLRPRSRWRHAVVRRSEIKNPTMRAVAEGAFHPTPTTPISNTTMSDTHLPGHPPEPGVPEPDTADVSTPSEIRTPPPSDPLGDVQMPDAPTDQATPELLISTFPTKAGVIITPSPTAFSSILTPTLPIKADTREPGVESTSVASTKSPAALSSSASVTAVSTQARQTENTSIPKDPSMLLSTTPSPTTHGPFRAMQSSATSATLVSAQGALVHPKSPSLQSGLLILSTARE